MTELQQGPGNKKFVETLVIPLGEGTDPQTMILFYLYKGFAM